jgi:predicted methyltransferase
MARQKHFFLAAALALCSVVQVQTGASAEPDPALLSIIASRSAEDRARDGDRHPAETLTFFQLRRGMTVAEAMPGSGWYSRILAPYLGRGGMLYGVNYADRMWPMFDRHDHWVRERIAATEEWAVQLRKYTDNVIKLGEMSIEDVPAEVNVPIDRALGQYVETGLRVEGFTFGTVPPETAGTVDRFLLIRVLHHLNRFEAAAGTRTQALAVVRAMLKDDGLVGVVQHRLPESAPEAGADGSRGYLKQSAVIAAFKAAGFELVASSEINANPRDVPGPDDTVWRLPPTLATSVNDAALRERMVAIGESDRMTLLFCKSSS